MATVYDIIIIGSGPSGYTAALYASRANLKVLQFLGFGVGGQLMLTSEVENYPGLLLGDGFTFTGDEGGMHGPAESADGHAQLHGILGPNMMTLFRRQAEHFGTEMIERDVIRVDFSERPFKVYADHVAEPYLARTVIIATGASAQWLGLPSEQRLQGRGVSACATCDGFFFGGKDVAVVGGGDTAMEEALFLTKFANKVRVIHRRDALRASKIMQERARKNPKIDFTWHTVVDEVLGEEAVTGLKLRNVQTDHVSEMPIQGLFMAIGHKPNTDLFKGIIDMDKAGYIVQHKHTMTNVPGVFAAGDVSDHRYRQAVTAAADGCRAAIDAERWLEEQHEVNLSSTEPAEMWGAMHAEQAEASR